MASMMRGLWLSLAMVSVVGCSDDGVGAGGTGNGTVGGTAATTAASTTGVTTVGLDSSGSASAGSGGTTNSLDSTTGTGWPETSSSGSAGTTSGGSGSEGTTGTINLPPFDPMCGDGGSSGSGTTGGGSTSTGGTTGAGTTGAGTTGTGGGAPNGSACSVDDDCASGQCYVAGVLGGICGECNEDADCPDGGCTLPNPLSGAPSVCNAGEQGGGCQSDASCCGIGMCGQIISVPGILTASTCGQCLADGDCPTGGLCEPDYDVVGLSGILECDAPGSLPDGHGCTLDDSGNSACDSGHCAAASLMGLVTVGVCSECETDADCPMGGTCQAPQVDLMSGLVAGTCG